MRQLLAIFLLLGLAFAQPGIPFPPEGGGSPPPASAIDAPDPYAIHTPKGKNIEEPLLNGEGISIMYFNLTGKRVLLSSASRNVEINLVQPGPLTNIEVAELIETQLMMEGFSLVQTPGKPNQLRLLPLSGSTFNAKQGGLKVITDESELPFNDEIVSFAMRLNYIKPEEAVRIFQSVVGQFGPAGSVATVPNASAIIITDNALLIRSFLEIKKQIDIPSTNVDTRFVKLVYADAEEVATQLNELINDEQQTSSSVQRTSNAAAPPPGNNIAQLSNNATGGEDIPLKILADNRTNRITLLGSLDKIAFAMGLIKEIDTPTSDSGFIRRKLKYLPVSEFIPIASHALEATLGTNAESATASNSANTTTTDTASTDSRASVGGEDGTTAPESLLIGKTLLVADNISNSIIVDGPPHHIEIINNLINELDHRSEQIAITALFGKYSSVDDSSFSTNIVSLYDQLTGTPQIGGGSLPSLTGTDISTIFTSTSLSTFASAALSTGMNLGYANSDYGVFVNAIKQTTEFEEISRPTVFTTNNRTARISSGSRIAIPTSTVTDAGTTATNIEYQDVVLELEVRPLVNGDDEVTIEVALVKDSLGGSRIIDELITQDIDTEELSTVVTVPNKSLIVLGGLYTDTSDATSSKFPILGDIPLLGRLFSSKSDSEDLDELVIMVYTNIIKSRSDLADYQRNYNQNSFIAPKAQKSFKANELLPPPSSRADQNGTLSPEVDSEAEENRFKGRFKKGPRR